MRKRFGQHFLHDPQVIARIVAAIEPRRGERIVEIGPGRGALTAPLLERLGTLTAIEIDRDLARALSERFGPALEIVNRDVLEIDLAALRGAGPALRLVGNLPYNISTPLLFHLLEQRAAIHDMHFMLQKEVVDRMVAAPGSRTYGRLTVMLAPWVRIERLLNVGPGAFTPPPKVSSAVVHLTPLAAPAFDIGSATSFERVVRAAFSQRRKTLRNALKGTVEVGLLERLGIDPGARPEQLAPAQFGALARASG
ncbi:MAG TPA: 16S rRNA (adenine(1518)-N(6)/adenine(1519)-N(6))-dimethyltransferase RsmA [Steroidobacteraceae bacterium]|nr:16S rRNA (adenine(1518)-N(6)/adenine(1519)-N(6))-dimethyltransferase RsmA [Steroidobacteraceae bacterium]